MNQKYEKEEKNSKARWPVLLLLLILLMLGAAIGLKFLLREKDDGEIVRNTASSGNLSGGVGLVIDPNVENGVSKENNNPEEQGVVISGWAAMTIPANKKDIAVDFYNPIENEELYYLAFELRLCDNNEQNYEVLYTSGLVEPGKHINRITLSHELEKGVYEAVVHVQPYRMNEEKTLTNNADMQIKLIVK